jgi:hypothetical protein
MSAWSTSNFSRLLVAAEAPTLEQVVAADIGDQMSPEEALSSFLDTSATKDDRERRAAVIVLALRADSDLLEAGGVASRKRVLAFVDGTFASYYRGWHVEASGPDHHRIASLTGVLDQVDTELERALDQFGALRSVEATRQNLQKLLGKHRALITPVIPGQLLKPKLGELFDAARQVNETDGPSFLAAHARASELLNEFSAETYEAGETAVRMLGGFLTRLESLFAEAYAANPATEPAELVAVSAPKKYPLAAGSGELRLGVQVVNHGPGQALDARLDELEAEGVLLSTESVPLGQLMPGTVSATIDASASPEPSDAAIVIGRLRWRDSDGAQQDHPFEATFESQRSDIPWESLKQRYDLDPVRTTADLVGRGDALRNLGDLIEARKVASAFITGQKRVGKTSIALTFLDSLAEDENIAAVYLEAGSFVQRDGGDTVTEMGRAIAEELRICDPRFADIEVPEFGDTLAPLKGLIGQMRVRVPKLRVMVILDEFDELPLDVYKRGAAGDALFLSLRTLAGLEHVGFVLVGGEKMRAIIDAQGDQLNKFESIPVNYLDRDNHWDDFSDLVRTPVRDCFEVTDDAVLAMFELTAGHPYFAKLIGRALFKLAVRRRDAHVTRTEIQHAAEAALASASPVNFIHFWEDGVISGSEDVEEVSVRRRKLLLAYSEAAEAGDRTLQSVLDRADSYGLVGSQPRELVREFERRDVLVQVGREVRAKVRLFDLWLRRYGVSAITTTFTDPDAVLHAKQRQQEQRVRPEEIVALVSKWDVYRGKAVTAEDVRDWLNQFESVRAQRLMFGILTGVRFYSPGLIRAKLNEAHSVVRQGLTHRVEPGKLKRNDIAVSYLGDVGKSGARYARLYADQNNIYADRVVEPAVLPKIIADDSVNAVVLVDDMLGSGKQATEFFSDLEASVGAQLRKRGLRVVFVAIAGFDAAQRRVVEAAERLGLPVDVHVCDPLGEEDRCFSPDASIYDSFADREEARGIAESYGRRLQRRFPLGYNDVQAAIVFDESCPNGSLPILWDSKADWRPLFPRHKGR